MFTVKEAADIMGISPHTLRFYDNKGLIPTLSRYNRRRLFSNEDLEWVGSILSWRETGMSVSDIKRYIGLYLEGDHTIDERYEMILRQREKAVEEVRAAKQRVKALQRKALWFQTIKDGKNADEWRQNIHSLVKRAAERKKDGARGCVKNAV